MSNNSSIISNGNKSEGAMDMRPPSKDELVKPVFSDHRLMTTEKGQSEVEHLVKRIETRRVQRIRLVSRARQRFVSTCRKIAKAKGYPIHKIQLGDVVEKRNQLEEVMRVNKEGWRYKVGTALGFRDPSEQLITAFDRAIEYVQYEQAENDDWLRYMDFNAFYTKSESKWPWMRETRGFTIAFFSLFFFYFVTPIIFCSIMNEEGICERLEGHPWSGWVSALYFASTTLSTVGYGDLSVSKDSNLALFVGTCYMIFANIILIVAFSSVAEHVSPFSGFVKWRDSIMRKVWGEPSGDELLYKKIRRVKAVRIGQIAVTFLFLNALGVLVNRIFVATSDSLEIQEQYTWMTSIYWAVQTTTTIGYGDLDQLPNQRWFQMFYLIISTAAVGNALGGLASLKQELEQVRRDTSWKRREVSKALVNECQPEENDGRVDQYEFVVASLTQLGKLKIEDVQPIMDKFRALAGDKGFIEPEDIQAATEEEIQATIDEAAAPGEAFMDELKRFAARENVDDDGENSPTLTRAHTLFAGATRRRSKDEEAQTDDDHSDPPASFP